MTRGISANGPAHLLAKLRGLNFRHEQAIHLGGPCEYCLPTAGLGRFRLPGVAWSRGVRLPALPSAGPLSPAPGAAI